MTVGGGEDQGLAVKARIDVIDQLFADNLVRAGRRNVDVLKASP
jgi:hypothetical protein